MSTDCPSPCWLCALGYCALCFDNSNLCNSTCSHWPPRSWFILYRFSLFNSLTHPLPVVIAPIAEIRFWVPSPPPPPPPPPPPTPPPPTPNKNQKLDDNCGILSGKRFSQICDIHFAGKSLALEDKRLESRILLVLIRLTFLWDFSKTYYYMPCFGHTGLVLYKKAEKRVFLWNKSYN